MNEILYPAERERLNKCESALGFLGATLHIPAAAILGVPGLRADSDRLGEDKDCTVTALAIAFGIGYEQARNLLARRFGRSHGKGCWFPAPRYGRASETAGVGTENRDILPGISLLQLPRATIATPGKSFVRTYGACTIRGTDSDKPLTWHAFRKSFAKPENAGRYIAHVTKHAFAFVVDEHGRLFCGDHTNGKPRRRVENVFKLVPTASIP